MLFAPKVEAMSAAATYVTLTFEAFFVVTPGISTWISMILDVTVRLRERKTLVHRNC